jgi:hypothetical protein
MMTNRPMPLQASARREVASSARAARLVADPARPVTLVVERVTGFADTGGEIAAEAREEGVTGGGVGVEARLRRARATTLPVLADRADRAGTTLLAGAAVVIPDAHQRVRVAVPAGLERYRRIDAWAMRVLRPADAALARAAVPTAGRTGRHSLGAIDAFIRRLTGQRYPVAHLAGRFRTAREIRGADAAQADSAFGPARGSLRGRPAGAPLADRALAAPLSLVGLLARQRGRVADLAIAVAASGVGQTGSPFAGAALAVARVAIMRRLADHRDRIAALTGTALLLVVPAGSIQAGPALGPAVGTVRGFLANPAATGLAGSPSARPALLDRETLAVLAGMAHPARDAIPERDADEGF